MEKNTSYFNIIRQKNDKDLNDKLYYVYEKYKELNIFYIHEINGNEFNSIDQFTYLLESTYSYVVADLNYQNTLNSFNPSYVCSYVDEYLNNNINKIEVKFPISSKGKYEDEYVSYTINKFYEDFNETRFT
jgi:hypothetical protein